jgi:hypothetical protein
MLGHEPPLTPALSPLRGEGVLGNLVTAKCKLYLADDHLFTWVQSNFFQYKSLRYICYPTVSCTMQKTLPDTTGIYTGQHWGPPLP